VIEELLVEDGSKVVAGQELFKIRLGMTYKLYYFYVFLCISFSVTSYICILFIALILFV